MKAICLLLALGMFTGCAAVPAAVGIAEGFFGGGKGLNINIASPNSSRNITIDNHSTCDCGPDAKCGPKCK